MPVRSSPMQVECVTYTARMLEQMLSSTETARWVCGLGMGEGVWAKKSVLKDPFCGWKHGRLRLPVGTI